jgi:hypothetical protein
VRGAETGKTGSRGETEEGKPKSGKWAPGRYSLVFIVILIFMYGSESSVKMKI